jgi:hypothetical protein
VSTIYHYWCQPYGLPETIVFYQGKVQTSRLESHINVLMPLGRTVNCRSNIEVFNHEVEQQWRNNQNDLSPEEFALQWNSLCNLQNPAKTETRGNDQEVIEVKDLDEDEVGTEDDQLPLMNDRQLHHLKKRKHVSLCRHKLQGRSYYRFRNQKPAQEQPRRLPEWEEVESEHE